MILKHGSFAVESKTSKCIAANFGLCESPWRDIPMGIGMPRRSDETLEGKIPRELRTRVCLTHRRAKRTFVRIKTLRSGVLMPAT